MGEVSVAGAKSLPEISGSAVTDYLLARHSRGAAACSARRVQNRICRCRDEVSNGHRCAERIIAAIEQDRWLAVDGCDDRSSRHDFRLIGRRTRLIYVTPGAAGLIVPD